MTVIMLPGIGGSEPGHWQSLWQERLPDARRFQPADWNRPDLDDWMGALERELAPCRTPPILVAHSLGCLLVAHWQQMSATPVAGAVLVAVPDPIAPAFPAEADGFAPVPVDRLRFPSLVVASSDDPYGTIGYACQRALAWGSGFVIAGAYGHINTASGLADWPQGAALLEAFCAGASVSYPGSARPA